MALGDEAPEVPADLKLWARPLRNWPRMVSVRAALAAGWLAYPAWSQDPDTVVDRLTEVDVQAAERVLLAVETWLGAPTEENASCAKTATHAVSGWYMPAGCFEAVGGTVWTKNPTGAAHLEIALTFAALVTSDAEVRAAVTAALLPWALGHHDPVLARVQARQAAAESQHGVTATQADSATPKEAP